MTIKCVSCIYFVFAHLQNEISGNLSTFKSEITKTFKKFVYFYVMKFDINSKGIRNSYQIKPKRSVMCGLDCKIIWGADLREWP